MQSAWPGGQAATPVTSAPPPRRVLTTAQGTNLGAYGGVDWLLLTTVAVTWGSTFLLISVALRSLHPSFIAWARVVVASATLLMVPAARRPIDPADRPRVVLLGAFWMAGPVLAFPFAQQWIDTSFASMVNSSSPLVTALIGALLLRRLPPRPQLAGLLIGLAGLAVLLLPTLQGAAATARGIALIMAGVTSYAIGANLAVPLQQRYGSLPLILRTQVVALVLLAPFGLTNLPAGPLYVESALALLPLGMFGSSITFIAIATLSGRVGAARAAIALYFVPLVATALGVLVLGEALRPTAIIGASLVLIGAWIVSRREATTSGRAPS